MTAQEKKKSREITDGRDSLTCDFSILRWRQQANVAAHAVQYIGTLRGCTHLSPLEMPHSHQWSTLTPNPNPSSIVSVLKCGFFLCFHHSLRFLAISRLKIFSSYDGVIGMHLHHKSGTTCIQYIWIIC